jgi:hypothetical protein
LLSSLIVKLLVVISTPKTTIVLHLVTIVCAFVLFYNIFNNFELCILWCYLC